MEQSTNDRPPRDPSDWESIGEFTEGGYYVKVNRFKGSRRFSMEMGGVSQTGVRMRFVPLVWFATDAGIEMDPALDASKLAALVTQAHKLVQGTLDQEGVQKRR